MLKMNKIFMTFMLSLTLIITSITVSADNTFNENSSEREPINIETIYAPIKVIKDFNLELKEPTESGNGVTIDSEFKIEIDWNFNDLGAIVEELEEGDYVEFQLSKEFKFTDEINGPLDDGDGTIYGDFTVDKNGLVRLTFNENALASVVGGKVKLDFKLDDGQITGPGEIVIEHPFKDKEDFVINLKPKNKQEDIVKTGKADQEFGANYITWTIDINRNYENLGDVSVSDEIKENLELVKRDIEKGTGGIEVYELNLDLNGNDLNISEKPILVTDAFDITLKGVNRPYRIIFKTKVNNVPEDGGMIEHTNTATIKFGDKVKEASSTVKLKYRHLLDKKSSNYDPIKQEITWKIEYNYGYKHFTDPVLVDTYSKELVYVAGTMDIRNSKGERLTEGTDNELEFKDNKDNSELVDMHITIKGDVKEFYDIKYTTKVDSKHIIGEGTKYTNIIKSDGKESSASVETKSQMIRKTSPKIDYEKETIDWEIKINQNNYEINNFSINDVYTNKGLKYIDDTLKVTEIPKDGSAAKVLELDVDYEFNTTEDNKVETGFNIKFINDYIKSDSSFTITYKTKYEYKDLDVKNKIFSNLATINYKIADSDFMSESSNSNRDVNNETHYNGNKTGSYDATSKELTWKINTNYYGDELNDAFVTDQIQSGQKYIDDSLVIKKYSINSDGKIVVSDDAENLSNFKIEYPNEENKNTLKISLPKGSDKYNIEFKVHLDETEIQSEYKNTAILTNGGKEYPVSSKVEVKHGGETINKTGEQDPNSKLINYEVYINRSQSTIFDAKLTDTPSDNLLIIRDSLNLYPMVVAADGTLVADKDNPLVVNEDYTVEFTENEAGLDIFNVYFTDMIDSAYYFTYSDEINASSVTDNTAKNSIVFSGNNHTFENSGGNSEFKFR